MKRIFLGLLMALSISCAHAQKVDIDLSKVSPDLAAEILRAQKKTEPALTVDNAEKWSQVGKNLAEGVSATAKGLSIEVNEFVKTPVGKFTFFVIAWKFIGAKIWSVIAGALIWLIAGSIIYRSFSWFHKERRRLSKIEDKTKVYEYISYKWRSEEAKAMSVIAHLLAISIVSIICMVAIL